MYRISSYAAAAILTGAAAYTTPAQAETDADLSRYCRETYPNSSPAMRAPGGVPAHYCNLQGTLQGIDLGRACELTTGRRDYRMVGTRVLCADGPGPDASGDPLRADDFVRFCREAFPGSVYQNVPATPETPHHCRLPGASGGFTLQPIDLAAACDLLRGDPAYNRDTGGNVFCTADDEPDATGERRAVAAAGDGDQQEENGPESDENEPEGMDNAEAEDGGKDTDGTGKAAEKSDKGGKTERGTWQFTGNSLRNGLRVRFDVSEGGAVTGTIVGYPPELAEVARTLDGLGAGDEFFVGEVSGGVLTGRTRIGIMGASQALNRAGNVQCKAFVAGLEQNRQEWMAVELSLDGGRLTGRHQVTGLTFGQSGCAKLPIPDTPPRIAGGFAALELKPGGSCTPTTTAKSGDDEAEPAKPDITGTDDEPISLLDRYDEALANDEPLEVYFWTNGENSWLEYTRRDGAYAGPHGDREVNPNPPSPDSAEAARILDAERAMRRAVEDGRWEGATLIRDVRSGEVRGVRIPPESLEQVRQHLLTWEARTRRIRAKEWATFFDWPSSIHDRPYLQEGQQEEPEPAPDDEPPRLLDLLEEAFVPC
jgi:hypothetical protein